MKKTFEEIAALNCGYTHRVTTQRWNPVLEQYVSDSFRIVASDFDKYVKRLSTALATQQIVGFFLTELN